MTLQQVARERMWAAEVAINDDRIPSMVEGVSCCGAVFRRAFSKGHITLLKLPVDGVVVPEGYEFYQLGSFGLLGMDFVGYAFRCKVTGLFYVYFR